MPKLLPQVTKVWLSIPLRIYGGNTNLDLSRIMIGLLLSAKAVLNPVAFGVAGLILDAQGRVLLVRQTYMTGWRIPGGGIDRGETPEAALRRELKEEIGLSGGEARLFGLYSRKVWWLTHITALYLIEGATVNFRAQFRSAGDPLGSAGRAAAGYRARHGAAAGRACGRCRAQPALVRLAFAVSARVVERHVGIC